MTRVLSCYYLDAPLLPDELLFVRQSLLGPWAKFKTGATALIQRRVPAVLPTPEVDGRYAEDRECRAERVRSNLRHAGIRADAGRQVVWVMPQDGEWDAIFQFAIRRETGFAPYAVQRWFMEKGAPVRGDVRIFNTQMLMQGL